MDDTKATQVYLTTKQHAFLREQAYKRNTTMSALIRSLVEEKIGRVRQEWVLREEPRRGKGSKY
jgi:hypothetical protein